MDIRSFFKTCSHDGNNNNSSNNNNAVVAANITSSSTSKSSVITTSTNNTHHCNLEFELGNLESGPIQKIVTHYPHSGAGKNRRSFQSIWFREFFWLEYSISQDSALCFVCRQFSRNSKEQIFISSGFNNWKKALQKFKEHQNSDCHKFATQKWCVYKSCHKHGTVINRLDSASVEDIKKRREYLQRIVETILLLAKQTLSFRGHDESLGSSNRGNFLEFLEYLKKFDSFLQKYIAPQNCTYTSSKIQNELLESAAGCLLSKFVDEVNDADYFAVMADDSRDVSSQEQMSICFRYIKNNTPKEVFIKFENVKKLDAVSLAETIQITFSSMKLTSVCVAQTYDGASVMSGKHNGVQEKLRAMGHRYAIYTHCYAHRLNLVLMNTCHAVEEADSFFGILKTLHSFFSLPIISHQKFLYLQTKLNIPNKNIDSLSTTRWFSHIKTIKAVKSTYPAILEYLKQQSSDAAAIGLKKLLTKKQTIMCLFIFEKLLGITSGIHELLQRENLNLSEASHSIKALIVTFHDMRNNNQHFEKICEAVDNFCNELRLNNTDETPSTSRNRKRPKFLEDFLQYDDNSSVRHNNDSKIRFQNDIYFPVLDRMLVELKQRFSGENEKILIGIEALNPGSNHFLETEMLSNFSTLYDLQIQEEECMIAKNFIA